MKTGKKKIEYVLRNVEKIFKDDLIEEVCRSYVQLIIDHELDEKSLNELIIEYTELFDDYGYDGQYTWIALAYTQFELGLLDEDVKNNAINSINDEVNIAKLSKGTKLTIKELTRFKELLNSKMPDKIVVRKPKYYKCPWNIGDVFAIKLDSDVYEDYGLQGKYIMFVKVDEHVCHPKHICPKILCYNWYGKEPLYDIENIKKLNYLPTTGFFDYKIHLIIENERELNDANLIYIGNIGTLELPKNIEENVKDELSKIPRSIKELKFRMIPINIFINRNYKIRPNCYQIVEIPDNIILRKGFIN